MKTLTTAVLVTLTLFGCSSSAQLVRKDTLGGQVALSGAYMPAMSEARMLMAEQCGGRFEAIEQGKTVVFRCKNAAAAAPVQVGSLGARGL